MQYNNNNYNLKNNLAPSVILTHLLWGYSLRAVLFKGFGNLVRVNGIIGPFSRTTTGHVCPNQHKNSQLVTDPSFCHHHLSP